VKCLICGGKHIVNKYGDDGLEQFYCVYCLSQGGSANLIKDEEFDPADEQEVEVSAEFYEQLQKTPLKCGCGAEVTYGVGTTTHADYCDLYELEEEKNEWYFKGGCI